jgi:hypothetical protein
LGEVRRIVPKLYNSIYISTLRTRKHGLAVSHHKFSPAALSLGTLHLVFVDDAVPFLARVLGKRFEEVLVNTIIDPSVKRALE